MSDQQQVFPVGAEVRIVARDTDNIGKVGVVERYEREVVYDYQREMVLVRLPGELMAYWYDADQLEATA